MKSEPISPLVLPTKPNKHPAITNTKCRKFKKDEGKRTAGTVCVQIQEIPAFSYKCSSCIKHVTATTCLVSFSFAWQRVNARTQIHTHANTHTSDGGNELCHVRTSRRTKPRQSNRIAMTAVWQEQTSDWIWNTTRPWSSENFKQSSKLSAESSESGVSRSMRKAAFITVDLVF